MLGKTGDIKVCPFYCFAAGPCIRHLSINPDYILAIMMTMVDDDEEEDNDDYTKKCGIAR